MRTRGSMMTMLLGAAALISLLPAVAGAQSPAYKVVAQGLNAPRGLRFGPDGAIYVAEGGTGGTVSTGSKCDQVPAPVGPYTGGTTGTIARISGGKVTRFATGFPSTQAATGDLSSVSDLTFLNGTLYALLSGGGCSHGNPNTPNGVVRVDLSTGKWTLIANLSAYVQAHPAAFENPPDFEPDETFFNMIHMGTALYVSGPNHGQILEVTTSGAVSTAIDLSASFGHLVPTALATANNLIYVGHLGGFPIVPGSERVITLAKTDGLAQAPGVSTAGSMQLVNSKYGFTSIVGMQVGPDGLVYVMELATQAGFPSPGQGDVVRIKKTGELEPVITGLNVPTGMVFGPDGLLYVSDFSAVPAPTTGVGRIISFELPSN